MKNKQKKSQTIAHFGKKNIYISKDPGKYTYVEMLKVIFAKKKKEKKVSNVF